MDYAIEALKKRREWKGKTQIQVNCPVETRDNFSNVYTSGTAKPCKKISKDVDKSYEYTCRGNIVAVVTDGTAVLGLGDIGPKAGMSAMEGKAVLFKAFGSVDAIPLCIRSKDTDEIVYTVEFLAGPFGGINLEDVAASCCFEIECRLKEPLDTPVFHDDQHGTAIVVDAALINTLKVVEKEASGAHGVVSGADSAGIACAKLLLSPGAKNPILCDRRGVICEGENWSNPAQAEMTKITNREHVRGTLVDVVKGVDFFLGVSAPNCVSAEMVKNMAQRPVVFAIMNPVPEISPGEAPATGVAAVGTGRSDYSNQVSNLLVFPSILRGALDVRVKDTNDEMKLAAVFAIVGMTPEEGLSPKYIIPFLLDERMAPEMAKTVVEAAHCINAARI